MSQGKKEGEWAERLKRAAKVSATALPPLPDSAIEHCARAYERAFGLSKGSVQLPQPLQELYRHFNGLNVTGDDLWIFGFNVLPLEPVHGDDARRRQAPRSVQQYRSDLKDMFAEWREDMTEEERANTVCNDAGWLPLAVAGEYLNYFINCQSDAKEYGTVKRVLLNEPSEKPCAEGLEEFWELVALFSEAKAVHSKIAELTDEPPEIEFEQDRQDAEAALERMRKKLAQLEGGPRQDGQ